MFDIGEVIMISVSFFGLRVNGNLFNQTRQFSLETLTVVFFFFCMLATVRRHWIRFSSGFFGAVRDSSLIKSLIRPVRKFAKGTFRISYRKFDQRKVETYRIFISNSSSVA